MIACGDRLGNIGIYSFDSFQKITNIEAHDGEVMALDFTLLSNLN